MEEFEAIEFPGIKFKTKLEMFKAISNDQEKIISIKKKQTYKAKFKGQSELLCNEIKNNTSIKSELEAKEDFIYPIISTTKYMDSHRDCHFDGCFKKTVKEQQGKVVYALDHSLKFDSIIAWEKDVKMVISDIGWGMVGKNYSGSTEALIFEIDKDKFKRKDVLEAIENKDSDFENSIRMVYHKIVLGVNSDDKDLKKAKSYYDKRISEIANKDVVEEVGYFWGIEELGIRKEGSLVVAGGSNDATSIFQKNEPSKDTHVEPEESTQKVARRLVKW
jgi:hypothetical protein